MQSEIESLISNIEKVIFGKRECIIPIIASLLCKGHVLIEDVPGVGKTRLVSAIAQSLNGKFNRIQLTPDIMPSDITGFSMIDQNTKKFVYKKGAAICNFLLADEINRTSPKVQSSLLEIMEEHQITIDSKTYFLPKPFMIMATQNPIESHGTYPLPEAQLDRFLIKISLGYLNFDDEIKLLDSSLAKDNSKIIDSVLSLDDITKLQEDVLKVNTSPKIKNFIVNISTNSRQNENIKLGISPRGSISLYNMSKAIAFINDRDFVIPEDVISISKLVLSHRILLSPKGKIDLGSCENAIDNILDQIEVPI